MNSNKCRRIAVAAIVCHALTYSVVVYSASDDILVSTAQAAALGVAIGRPEAASTATISGLAARVVVPSQQLHVVSAPLPGLVESVKASVDERVRAGQILGRLRSPALAEAQRGFLQAVTQLTLARGNLSRDEKLLAEGIIADSRVRASRAAHAEASAVYAERRQMLQLAGMTDATIRNLGTGRGIGSVIDLRAPVDGVVLERMATVGQRLEGYAPVYRIANVDILQLDIQVPASRLGGVKQGAVVVVGSTDARGTVVSVARSVDPDSQTATVRALIDRNADRLRVGQNVEASLVGASDQGAVWRVPREAVTRVDPRALVWEQTRTGFRAIEVKLLHDDSGGYTVSGPLKADAQIAVKGTAALKARYLGLGSS